MKKPEAVKQKSEAEVREEFADLSGRLVTIKASFKSRGDIVVAFVPKVDDMITTIDTLVIPRIATEFKEDRRPFDTFLTITRESVEEFEKLLRDLARSKG